MCSASACTGSNSGTQPTARNETEKTMPDGNPQVRVVTDKLDKAAYLRLCINGISTDCLLDTGSEVCLFPSKYRTSAFVTPTEHRLYAANGTPIMVDGVIIVEAMLNAQRLSIEGFVSAQVSEIILGLSFLRKQHATWRFGDGMIEIGGYGYQLYTRETGNACRRVILDSDIVLKPKTETIATTYVKFGGKIRNDSEWATQPQQVTAHVHAARALLPQRALDVPVKLINTSSESVRLPAGTVIANVEPVQLDPNTGLEYTATSEVDECVREGIEKMIAQIDGDVSESGRNELRHILYDCSRAFSFRENDIGHSVLIKTSH